MPIRHAIWKVSAKPELLAEAALANEQLLENMIVSEPRILSDEWMLIGRQEDTGLGGRIDLLAIAPDGTLILIELKRNRTPREVVAQAIDYAAWVEKLQPEEIAAIYSRFSQGGNLADDFQKRFGQQLDEEALNQSHQIVVVAASLDNSSERIIGYLHERDVPINVLCFQVFEYGDNQLLSRAWLLDPADTQASAAAAPSGTKEPWNGEFYACFGHCETRSWAEARKYGFICAGGGTWYSNTLNLLNPGDRVWVKAPGYGFVGVGRVLGKPEPISTFSVETPDSVVPAVEVLKEGSYHRDRKDDPDRAEYFVRIRWAETVPIEQAVNDIGLFGNQNTVCKPTTPKWRYTVEQLKKRFLHFAEA